MPATNARGEWIGGNLINYPTAAGGYVGRGVSDKSVYGPFGGLIYANTAASAAVSNTASETAFDKSVTVPAGDLVAGSVLRIRAQCIATSTNSTDTLNVKLKFGSTVIVATGAVDATNNDVQFIDATVIVRTAGASGTMVATGTVATGVEGTVTAKPFKLASTTLDTTAAVAVTVSATWSVASSSNSVRLDVLTVELF